MDDDDPLISTALPVADGTFDASELLLPPSNGMDYLRRVRHEAMNCPATVTASNAPIRTAQKRLRKGEEDSDILLSMQGLGCSPAPAGYAPSLAWQQKQVSDFSGVRLKLQSYIREKNPKQCTMILPEARNAEKWCRLCFGRFYGKEKGTPVDRSFGPEDSPTEEGVSKSVKVADREDDMALPLLSLISRIDQTTLLNVLEYHINWFEATGFTTHQGQWFYALLAALEKPLLPEACSLIRSLARLCSNLRASLEGDSNELLPQLNLIICIVGRYFDQTDLADKPA